jgi:dienelactone hydrolase
MTVYSPTGKNTGAAVVVFPGGGYWILAVDLEGTEVCDWLTAKGITCVLLKYRVPGDGKEPRSGPYPKSPLALEDAQRTVGLVRFHAAEWHIDPRKIGVLGFSAGGHLVAAISTHFEQRLYPTTDAADKESCRPDFAVALYPGHLSLADNSFALNPDIAANITRQTPPTFLLQNEDDHVDRVEDSLSYYAALKKAGVPVEMHLYAQGAWGGERDRWSSGGPAEARHPNWADCAGRPACQNHQVLAHCLPRRVILMRPRHDLSKMCYSRLAGRQAGTPPAGGSRSGRKGNRAKGEDGRLSEIRIHAR